MPEPGAEKTPAGMDDMTDKAAPPVNASSWADEMVSRRANCCPILACTHAALRCARSRRRPGRGPVLRAQASSHFRALQGVDFCARHSCLLARSFRSVVPRE